ncbi:MAG: bifunctional (p)ppGpp synthetase/guanosine-3',5'-bis(diphosphate) 3'-pyrophosphohydrolase, partial [Bacilli bacterium]|nr:bifunctional (p)ppGpp synthetase/guanosine-3',5'-bis(diphosphate) 3'-pyrophosphohydrolase [Bacilli bacterium]
YQKIKEKREKIEEDSKDILKEMLSKIQGLLNDRNIPNEIKIRTKNIYGIYKKLNEGQKMSDIHDLLALKVMVDEIDNCYRALGVVHMLYHPINDKFKDYIWNPKTNLYQSIHTTVFGPGDRLVQTQIRTFDMDKVASFGLTAYWDIEKGNARNVMQSELKSKFQFFKSLVEINAMFGDNQEFVNQVKSEIFTDKVYVLNSKGETIELPKGSNIIDFAYALSDDIGNTMVGAYVNDEYVPVEYVLRNKDRVRVVTDDLAFGQRIGWADKAYTSYARQKILEFNKK